MNDDPAPVDEVPESARPPALPPPLPPPVFEPLRVATSRREATPFGSPDRYRSPHRVAAGLHLAVATSIAINMLEVASLVRDLGLLDRLDSSPQLVRAGEVDAADQREQAIGWIGIGVALIVFGFLVALTRRLYRNVPSLSNYPRRFTDGWAVGAWFVPFLNFVRPKQIIDDIWRATSPEQPAWWPPKRPPVPKMLHFWWASLLVAALFARAADGGTEANDIAEARQIVQQGIMSDIASILFGVLTIVVTWRLVQRDRERAFSVIGVSASAERSLAPRLLGALGIGIAALVVGLVAFQTDPVSGDDGRAVEDEPGGDTGSLVVELMVGDCFDLPTNDGEQPQDSDDVTMLLGVSIQPCDSPHDAQVYAIVQHPAAANVKYPGDTAMIAKASELCLAPFEAAIGSTFEKSSLDMYFLWPGKSWSVGDREIKCVAFPMSGEALAETVIDSGL